MVELTGTSFFPSSTYSIIYYCTMGWTFITETSAFVWAVEITYHVFKYMCIPPDIFTSGALVEIWINLFGIKAVSWVSLPNMGQSVVGKLQSGPITLVSTWYRSTRFVSWQECTGGILRQFSCILVVVWVYFPGILWHLRKIVWWLLSTCSISRSSFSQYTRFLD